MPILIIIYCFSSYIYFKTYKTRQDLDLLSKYKLLQKKCLHEKVSVVFNAIIIFVGNITWYLFVAKDLNIIVFILCCMVISVIPVILLVRVTLQDQKNYKIIRYEIEIFPKCKLCDEYIIEDSERCPHCGFINKRNNE